MALIANDVLTLADWYGRRDPSGKHAMIAEVMSRKDELMADVMFMEANNVTMHEDTLRSELPIGEFRAYNEGVGRGKSKTETIKDGIANNQLYGVVDKDLADLSGDAARFRFNEEKGVMEGLRQQFVDTLLYGNADVNPKSFTGLTPRFNTIQDRVISAGDAANRTSIWLVCWGEDSVRGIFPKGMRESAGLTSTDKGIETVVEPGGTKEYEAYRTHYRWMAGLSIKDYRNVVRICNIDSDSTTADLTDLLIQAVHWIEDDSNLKIYMNRQMMTIFDKQARDGSNVHLTVETIDGRKRTHFRGYPLRRCDAIVNNESAVS